MNGQVAVPGASSRAMILTLGLVATLCGVLIVTAYQGTLEAVTANKRIALERAVFKVIPGAATMQEFVATAQGITAAGSGEKFYAAFDAAGALKGVAAEAAAPGYADGTALANPIKVVKHGSKRNPWEIDAISGATVTTKAVGKGINDSAQRLLPRLVPHLDKVRGK